MNEHQIFDWIFRFVVIASIISWLMPPIETFDGFPRFQKFYVLIVRIVSQYASLNLRGKMLELYKVKGDRDATNPK